MKRGENVFNLGNVMKKINHIISEGAKTIMTDTQFLEKEIKKFKIPKTDGNDYRGKILSW